MVPNDEKKRNSQTPRYRSASGKKGAAARGSKATGGRPFSVSSGGDVNPPTGRKIPQKKPFRTYSNSTTLQKAADRRVNSTRPAKPLKPATGRVPNITTVPKPKPKIPWGKVASTAGKTARFAGKGLGPVGWALAGYETANAVNNMGKRNREKGMTHAGPSGSKSGYPAAKTTTESRLQAAADRRRPTVQNAKKKHDTSGIRTGAYATSTGKSRNLRMGMIAGGSKPGSYTTYNKERPGFKTTKSYSGDKIYTAKRGDSFKKIAASNATKARRVEKANPWLASKTKERGGNPIYSGSKVRVPGKQSK